MKRSEVVNALVKFVYEASGGHAELFAEEASLVLKWLEELGMQPPLHKILEEHYNRSEGEHGFWVSEWETED